LVEKRYKGELDPKKIERGGRFLRLVFIKEKRSRSLFLFGSRKEGGVEKPWRRKKSLSFIRRKKKFPICTQRGEGRREFHPSPSCVGEGREKRERLSRKKKKRAALLFGGRLCTNCFSPREREKPFFVGWVPGGRS